MLQYTWIELEDLYQRARRDETGAWEDLHCEAVERLKRWIQHHFNIGRIPPWEVEESATSAFEEVGLRIERIPTWAQAWEYAKKSLMRAVCRKLKRPPVFQMSENHQAIDDLDFILEIETIDLLEVFFDRLTRETAHFLLAYIEIVLSGRHSVVEIARILGICERSLRNRLSALNAFWGRHLKV